MKIYKSNYRNHWVSPYTILEALCFWEKGQDRIYDHDPDAKNPYRWWVNFLTPICGAWCKFLDLVHPQINYVKIDRWDSWNMDSTLSDIILPLLKQLNDKNTLQLYVPTAKKPTYQRSP